MTTYSLGVAELTLFVEAPFNNVKISFKTITSPFVAPPVELKPMLVDIR
jgi:hypothetical protein